MKNQNKLPTFFEMLLKFFLDDESYNEKSGDLTEVFTIAKKEDGLVKAMFWLSNQSFKTVIANIKDKVVWGGAMFRNYLLITFRNLFKQKVFSFINVFGLAIGITSCLLIALFVKSELSVDNYHKNIERIYHTGQWFNFSGKENVWSASNALTATVLAKEFPQIEKAARLKSMGTVMIRQGVKLFTENNLMYADPEIFDILTWPLLSGDKENLLQAPYTIVISHEMAEKYFGNENPVGKTLKINNENDFTIQAVMQDIPENSFYDPDAFCSMQSLVVEQPENSSLLNSWNSYNFRTLLLLENGADAKSVQKEMNAGFHKHADKSMAAMGMESNLLLKPYNEMYLEPFSSSSPPIVYVYIFSIVAIAILFIACINFMNLSTARSASRAKEVGIRKVLGSEKKRLIAQFLSESIIVAFVSLGLSIILAWLTIPLLNTVVTFNLSLGMLAETNLIIYMIIFTLLVGLLAGIYPAFFLSSFQPVSVLQGKLKSGATNIGLRKVLVVGQFTVSIILIIGSAVIFQQLDYLKSKDPGFDKEQLLLFRLPANSDQSLMEIIRSELMSSSLIKNVSGSSVLPGNGSPADAVIPEGFTEETTQTVDELNVDRDFIKTMGMEIVNGRDFSIEFGEFEPNSVIINEAAVKSFGWDDPIGKTIKTYDPYTDNRWRDVYVVGVVKDFHQRPVIERIHPVFITCDRNLPHTFAKLRNIIARVSTTDISETISFIENKWNKLLPEVPFSYRFMDDVFDQQFSRVERAQKVVGFFTALTVLVACLGLFGLISYLTEQRTKEIGVRKVLGAPFRKLVLFLIKDFSKWILFANLIALPISYFVAKQILSGFAYRIDLNLLIFLLSGLAVFLVGLSTIIMKVVKAAGLNPVDTLKHE